MSDDVKAAAERLLEEAAAHIEAVVSGGHDPLTDDILTVASYALEAGREVARLTEELAFQAKNAADAHQERAHQQRRAADALEAYGLLQDELHVYHAREELQWSKTAPEMDDCPKCAALSTPGEPESSGGG